ncbi:cysteine desulfurase [Candidatus Peregrinibacteria bacterium]|jgi:cysteine desulfurase / selenocysteine lyase|nr:cysteine desulfurase [Candidatus Peregrinibacteria bacterium]MBT3598724.1 cysteine desulfurase [Candidatus Peregrinibacteria bacterium]MBT4366862.1 cysteine desulfurase [Candidatus Peregrinibacteria bacterium]MBT4585744.1 cysteine desulfurase [Candidatus Peregrinibacteria bacterium]MBT6731266.1 cysteine desulfurase [Candidatus Peregrinibacteria bacterium]
MKIDLINLRESFSIFEKEKSSAYLDSAATAQVPDSVINKMEEYYKYYCSNVHRGVNLQNEKSTNEFETARNVIQSFVDAKYVSEIVFTKNCTESINLVANGWAKHNLKAGDGIVLSILEHHSNIVPWLQLKKEIGINLHWIDLSEDGQLDMNQYEKIIEEENIKLVAITGQSNVLGIQTDLINIIAKAKAKGAPVLVDAAQLIAHKQVNVQKLDCDFLAFSGHKLYGPTGIGVLYVKRERQEEMQPWITGGGSVLEVHRDKFIPSETPSMFEAGTPPIAEAIGLAESIKWINMYEWKDIQEYESSLISYATEEMNKISSLKILGSNNKHGCISFILDGIHPHDVADIAGEMDVSIRAGNHCAMPLHTALGIPASNRMSIALYNKKEDIDLLIKAINKAITIFSK